MKSHTNWHFDWDKEDESACLQVLRESPNSPRSQDSFVGPKDPILENCAARGQFLTKPSVGPLSDKI